MTDTVTPGIELSPEQAEAASLIQKWYTGSEQEFRLGGYAGTGKTTLIKHIIQLLNVSTEVVAFTGKAVSVLRRKGIDYSQTMHSLLYRHVWNHTTKRYDSIPKDRLYGVDLVIVDEASMVSTSLYGDLKKHGIKMLLVGDPAQLEPVGDNPDLMKECNYVLKTIHRQAQGSGIIRLAQAVRRGMTDIPKGEWPGILVTDDSSVLEELYDVVICGRNVTRHRANARIRKALDFAGEEALVEGEHVLCLKNSTTHGVANGQTFKVERVLGQRESFALNCNVMNVDLVDDLETRYPDVPMPVKVFGHDMDRAERWRNVVPFDYGYCLTAHKSQGSEWAKVLVINEPIYGLDPNRWLYTALTRGSEHVTLLL